MKKYSKYLEDKAREEYEAGIPFPYTQCADCNEYREVIELMSKWMSIGGFQQKTPQKIIKEFRATMKRANKVIRLNKAYRRDNEDVEFFKEA